MILDNSNLKIATSRNYHHFFPRKYLSDAASPVESNLIANITFIGGYSNKHRIGKKAPSEYISKFSKGNKDLGETPNTHLINIDAYGIAEDDYDCFIARRSRAIANAMNVKLLTMTAADAAAQEIVAES